VRPGPVLTVIAVAAIVLWLLTEILILAAILAGVLLLLAGAVLYLRRTSDRDTEALARQSAGLRAEVAAERQHAAPKSLTVVNVQSGAHVHLTSGETVAGHIAPPVPGAVIREENPWHNYPK
jgi:hypothetical protein